MFNLTLTGRREGLNDLILSVDKVELLGLSEEPTSCREVYGNMVGVNLVGIGFEQRLTGVLKRIASAIQRDPC